MNVVEYEINEEAIQFLNSIKGPVSVVTIAGEFRSGKSYLLSAMIGHIGAFKIGHTYKGVTKGFWIYNKAIQIKNSAGEIINVILIDSEGLAYTKDILDQDLKAFMLTLLMSSDVILNYSKHFIDRQMIE